LLRRSKYVYRINLSRFLIEELELGFESDISMNFI